MLRKFISTGKKGAKIKHSLASRCDDFIRTYSADNFIITEANHSNPDDLLATELFPNYNVRLPDKNSRWRFYFDLLFRVLIHAFSVMLMCANTNSYGNQNARNPNDLNVNFHKKVEFYHTNSHTLTSH